MSREDWREGRRHRALAHAAANAATQNLILGAPDSVLVAVAGDHGHRVAVVNEADRSATTMAGADSAISTAE